MSVYCHIWNDEQLKHVLYPEETRHINSNPTIAMLANPISDALISSVNENFARCHGLFKMLTSTNACSGFLVPIGFFKESEQSPSPEGHDLTYAPRLLQPNRQDNFRDGWTGGWGFTAPPTLDYVIWAPEEKPGIGVTR